MRKSLSYLLLLLLVAVSCEPDPTTYQIVNNREYLVPERDSFADGSMYDVVVFAYFQEDIAWQDNLDDIPPAGGMSDKMELPDGYDMVRISFVDVPIESELFDLAEGFRQFVARYDTLEAGKNNLIFINDSTMTRIFYDF